MRWLVPLAFLVACTHGGGSIDRSIGAGCTSSADCTNTCFDTNDLPGGFCSRGCATDQDCPADAVCAAAHGGVCLFACPPFDCTRLGAGYACRQVDDSTGGKVDVCIGN